MHVKERLTHDIAEDSQLLSNTAIDYAIAVRHEYEGLYKGHMTCHQSIEMPDEGYDFNGETEISEHRRLRRRFIRLVAGDNGPFAKIDKARIPV